MHGQNHIKFVGSYIVKTDKVQIVVKNR